MLRGASAERPHLRVARHADDEPGGIVFAPPHRRPTASPSVQQRPAMASLMITTGWVSGRSASLKLRPRRISMPTTSKNSGSTAARYAMKAPWSIGGSNPSTLKSARARAERVQVQVC